MLKSKVKTISTLALAGMMAMGGILATGTEVHALNNIQSGETPVSYDNRQVLPDDNAQYGMIIPTAIAFDDANSEANADVSITGINGFDLADWSDLSVTAKVKSQNAYKLVGEGTAAGAQAAYKLKYGTEMQANTDEQEISTKLGTGTSGAQAKVSGTATLDEASKATATKKGIYKDKLTYSFTEVTNVKK